MSAIKRLAEALNEVGIGLSALFIKKLTSYLRGFPNLEFESTDDYNTFKVIPEHLYKSHNSAETDKLDKLLDNVYMTYDTGAYEPEQGKTYDYYWDKFYNGDYVIDFVYRTPHGKEVSLDVGKDDIAFRTAVRFLIHNYFETEEDWDADPDTGGRSRDTW